MAEAELGVREIAGPRAQERILGYWRLIGNARQSSDEVPWCAVFLGACLVQAGYRPVDPPELRAMARQYLHYGRPLAEPEVGAIVVFRRGAAPKGHVAFVAGFTATHILALGGNQGDAVSSAWFARKDVLGYRMPTALDRLAPPEPVTPPEPEAPAPASLAPETAAPPVEANAPAGTSPPAAPVFPKLKDAKESWTVTGILTAVFGGLLMWLNDMVTLAITFSGEILGVMGQLAPVRTLLGNAGVTVPNVGFAMLAAGATVALHRRLFKDGKPR